MEKKAFPIGLTGNMLKIIAMLAMFIDHAGLLLFPRYMIFRMIGRLAFPIFAFMIAEGCFYTKNRARYLGMIFGLGAICQLVATVATGDLVQGILLTFSCSIAIIYCVDTLKKETRTVPRCLLVCALAGIAFLVLGLPHLLEDYGFRFDYGTLGVLLPVLLYYLRGDRLSPLIAMAVVLVALSYLYTPIQLCSLLALPLLALYNGKRGKWKLKYLFYIFYPAHLVLLYLIAMLIPLVQKII